MSDFLIYLLRFKILSDLQISNRFHETRIVYNRYFESKLCKIRSNISDE